MKQADEIRKYVFQNYVIPAREEGNVRVLVKAGDVHDAMGLDRRMPAVCDALSTVKFQEEYGLSLTKREGPKHGKAVTFTFEVNR